MRMSMSAATCWKAEYLARAEPLAAAGSRMLQWVRRGL